MSHRSGHCSVPYAPNWFPWCARSSPSPAPMTRSSPAHIRWTLNGSSVKWWRESSGMTLNAVARIARPTRSRPASAATTSGSLPGCRKRIFASACLPRCTRLGTGCTSRASRRVLTAPCLAAVLHPVCTKASPGSGRMLLDGAAGSGSGAIPDFSPRFLDNLVTSLPTSSTGQSTG